MKNRYFGEITEEQVNKILVCTRHELSNEQLYELKRLFGNIELYHQAAPVTSGYEVAEIAKKKGCNICLVVLPTTFKEQLLKAYDGMVISAVMNRVIDPLGTVKFNFMHFEQILKVNIITRKL